MTLLLSLTLARTSLRDSPSVSRAGFHVGCVHNLPLKWTALWNHSDSRCESRCDGGDCLWINDGFVMNWQPIQGVSFPVHYGTRSSAFFGISTLPSGLDSAVVAGLVLFTGQIPPHKARQCCKCWTDAGRLVKALWWRQQSHVKSSCAQCWLWFFGGIKGRLRAERRRENANGNKTRTELSVKYRKVLVFIPS